MRLSLFSENRKRRKHLRELLRHARHVRNVREDILADADLRRLADAENEARRVLKDKGAGEALDQAGETLYAVLVNLTPKHRWSGFKENFEILVVAVAVAMGFRTYFFQPFKIPTGSMEPTLCGIQTDSPVTPTLWDRMPLKTVKWALTGQWYMEVKARNSGEFLSATPQDLLDNRVYQVCYVGRRQHKLPRGAQIIVEDGDDSREIQDGDFVRKGDVLWSGMRTSGDHVFVNKIAWNFRSPRREEVIVFRTDGVPIRPSVPPGTHYIKRLVGLPGEQVSIADGEIAIDGAPIPDPRRHVMARLGEDIYPRFRGTGLDRWAALKAGSQLNHDGDVFPLNERQYFTLGDNAASSLDGRYWGHVPEKNLVGPAVMVYWPLSRQRWGAIR